MRINLLGGPGSGKSTTTAWLFSELKRKNYSIELVTEYVKSWVAQKREVNGFDQVYLFGKQMQYEHRYLSTGIKNIVTDSPLILSCVYTEYYNPELYLEKYLYPLEQAYESKFPSVNIYLNRKDKEYHTEGRYQTREQAIHIDSLIKEYIKNRISNIHYVDYNDREKIFEIASSQCDIKN